MCKQNQNFSNSSVSPLRSYNKFVSKPSKNSVAPTIPVYNPIRGDFDSVYIQKEYNLNDE